jgi:hypothetical protein
VRWLFVVMLALAGCKAVKKWADDHAPGSGSGSGSADPELAPPPPPPPQGPGLSPGRYRIVDVTIHVSPTKHGKPWDTSADSVPAPDLEVELRVSGKQVADCVASADATHGHCNPDVLVDLVEDSWIELVIRDDDGAFDDEVGTARILGSPATWDTHEPLRAAARGRVQRAHIVLEAEPTWWDRYRARILAMAIGIAAALAITGLFRRSILVPDPVPPPPPRCAHCSAKVRARDRHCPNCGAAQ